MQFTNYEDAVNSRWELHFADGKIETVEADKLVANDFGFAFFKGERPFMITNGKFINYVVALGKTETPQASN